MAFDTLPYNSNILMKKTLIIRKFLLIIPLLLMISCLDQPSRPGDPDNLVIYPQPPGITRIQYLTSFSSSSDFEGEQGKINKFLIGEKRPVTIVKPYGVNVSGSKIYICDTGIKGLIILNTDDQSFKVFTPGGRGQLQMPFNCDLDFEGNLYIADGNRRQLVIFDKDLNYLNELSLVDKAKPTDVKVDSTLIYVSASDNHRIEVYNRNDLSLKTIFPKAGINEKEYLYQPLNIELDENYIYVSDIGNCSVKVFDKKFKLVNSFGSPGNGLGQFTRPKGISADKEGNIYVVDAAFENVQIFNSSGDLLLYFGGTYTGPGGMWLPADVTIDYGNLEYFNKYVDPAFKLEYLIYVSNQYGKDKLSIYGFVGLTE